MKHDPYKWHEVNPNEKIQVGKGVLRVRVSVASALYVASQGVESLVGVATSHDVEISDAVEFWIDAPDTARVFYERAYSTSREVEGEVFTNIDRMPGESGTINEVMRAMRELELARRATLRDIRNERASMRAEAVRLRGDPASAPLPASAPDPAAAPDPEAAP